MCSGSNCNKNTETERSPQIYTEIQNFDSSIYSRLYGFKHVWNNKNINHQAAKM